MNLIRCAKDKIKRPIKNYVRAEVQKALEYMLPQLIEFNTSPKEDRQSHHDHTKNALDNKALYSTLKDRLKEVGVPVEEVDIDINDFERWMEEFSEIRQYYEKWGESCIEKCLEYYLTYHHLKISKNDVYVDIGGATSPWAEILRKKGIKSYRLDLSYPEGVRGINIGADAGNTNLPDGFCTVMSAHCSFECFMGDSDFQFVKEVSRILDKKGRYGIVPLYLDDTYFVSTSPYCDQREIKIENEAKRVWQDNGGIAPFERHYSPEAFKNRIYSNIPKNMKGKVLYFRNLDNVIKHYEGQTIYCFFMFCCEK